MARLDLPLGIVLAGGEGKRLMPLTAAVFIILVALTVLLLIADIVNPVSLNL